MSAVLATAKALEQRKVIPMMRSAISDAWLPKYRKVVLDAFRQEAREAADVVLAGGEIASLTGHWWARQVKDQWPLALGMAVEGYNLTQSEFGKTAGISGMIQGKLLEDVAAPDPGDVIQAGFAGSDALQARKLAPDVEHWLQESTKAMSETSLNRATKIVLEGRAEGLTVQQLSRDLYRQMVAYGRPRAEMVARSATIWNYNEGAQHVYAEAGVGAKEWLVTADDMLCEFCEEMAGVHEVMADAFVPGGTAFAGSQGGTLNIAADVQHPPLHPSCRCALIPVL